jgi:hypothetical protein
MIDSPTSKNSPSLSSLESTSSGYFEVIYSAVCAFAICGDNGLW